MNLLPNNWLALEIVHHLTEEVWKTPFEIGTCKSHDSGMGFSLQYVMLIIWILVPNVTDKAT